MTKFYSLAAAGALVLGTLSAVAGPAKVTPAFKKGNKVEMTVHPALAKTGAVKKNLAAKKQAAVAGRHHRIASMAENQVWRPVKQIVSMSDGGEWIPSEEYTTTWTPQGYPQVDLIKALDEEDTYSRVEYVYDEFGMLTEQTTYVGETADNLVPSSRRLKEYDPKMHNLLLNTIAESWDEAASAWVSAGASQRRVVTRDADGNVTSVQLELAYNGRYDPISKYEFFYGDDKKANNIVYSEMEFDYSTYEPVGWFEDLVYDNIEWYAFDGQIYDMDCIYEGNNKVKAFTQMYEGEPVVVSTVTYVGDTDDFTLVGRMTDGVFEQTWTNYPNGGYLSEVVQTTEGVDGSVEKYVESAMFNELGNDLLGIQYTIYDGVLEFGTYLKGEEVLDPATELPVTYIQREFMPLEEGGDEEEYFALSRMTVDEITAPLDELEGDWEDFVKIEYSDYQIAGTGAVDKIATDIADGKAEYFTIDGRRVNGTPASGLYIRRTATGAQKVLVK